MNPLSEELCVYLDVHPKQVTEEGFMITAYTTHHIIVEWHGRVHMTVKDFQRLVAEMEL